jgi:predicted membrane-bound spermidine synthase
MMKSKLIALTFILFTLSGFSGLIYEGVWARYLKLLLGHSAYGQILTLCIYMGGLGIGAFLAVRLLPRIRRPLFAYAVTEACIGLGGFAYHTLYTTSTDLLFSSGILLGMGITTATCLKLILAILITGPFAVLLGMTFPFITSGLIRILDDQGEASISRMYFTNSLGAAIGIIILSFWLIPALGTHGALMTSASINLLIAGLFFLISQRLEAKYKGTIQSIQADSKRHPVDRGFVRTMLVIA